MEALVCISLSHLSPLNGLQIGTCQGIFWLCIFYGHQRYGWSALYNIFAGRLGKSFLQCLYQPIWLSNTRIPSLFLSAFENEKLSWFYTLWFGFHLWSRVPSTVYFTFFHYFSFPIVKFPRFPFWLVQETPWTICFTKNYGMLVLVHLLQYPARQREYTTFPKATWSRSVTIIPTLGFSERKCLLNTFRH